MVSGDISRKDDIQRRLLEIYSFYGQLLFLNREFRIALQGQHCVSYYYFRFLFLKVSFLYMFLYLYLVSFNLVDEFLLKALITVPL